MILFTLRMLRLSAYNINLVFCTPFTLHLSSFYSHKTVKCEVQPDFSILLETVFWSHMQQSSKRNRNSNGIGSGITSLLVCILSILVDVVVLWYILHKTEIRCDACFLEPNTLNRKWYTIFSIFFFIGSYTAQKVKLLIKDFFSKYDKIYGKLRFCFLKKSFMKNLIFCAVLKIDFLAYFGESPCLISC